MTSSGLASEYSNDVAAGDSHRVALACAGVTQKIMERGYGNGVTAF